MLKPPSLISVLIFVIFIVLIKNSFLIDIGINPECIRYFKYKYNWGVFIPIFYSLLFFSILEIFRVRKKLKENILSILFMLPVLLNELKFLINACKNIYF